MAEGAAIAAGIGLVGSVMQANAQKEQAKAEAAGLGARAKALDNQATEINSRFELFTKKDINVKKQILQGEQVAALAKGGVNVSAGTSLSIIQETARLSVEELMRAKREAMFESETLRSEAKSARDQISGVLKAGKLASTASLLGGASSAGGALAFFNKSSNKPVDPSKPTGSKG
jgi:hypothetical protein